MREHRITPSDLKWAREEFERIEPRDLFYRVASNLVRSAFEAPGSLSLAEALATLLQTWNREYYRFRRFDAAHLSDIERLLRRHEDSIGKYRNRNIDDLDPDEKSAIGCLFETFEAVLGAVGSAKAFHLLAPRFFPLWDRAIAKEYGCIVGKRGTNGGRYWKFMLTSRRQYREIAATGLACDNLLKSIDEYNYCRFTKRLRPPIAQSSSSA